MAVTVRPLTEAVGVEILGVDLKTVDRYALFKKNLLRTRQQGRSVALPPMLTMNVERDQSCHIAVAVDIQQQECPNLAALLENESLRA